MGSRLTRPVYSSYLFVPVPAKEPRSPNSQPAIPVSGDAKISGVEAAEDMDNGCPTTASSALHSIHPSILVEPDEPSGKLNAGANAD
jgi:hypothetical protein